MLEGGGGIRSMYNYHTSFDVKSCHTFGPVGHCVTQLFHNIQI